MKFKRFQIWLFTVKYKQISLHRETYLEILSNTEIRKARWQLKLIKIKLYVPNFPPVVPVETRFKITLRLRQSNTAYSITYSKRVHPFQKDQLSFNTRCIPDVATSYTKQREFSSTTEMGFVLSVRLVKIHQIKFE